jgi:heme-degrading monooxygenase HmoA
MLASVTTSSVPKDKIDATNKILVENLWPAIKKQKGYKGLLTLTNPETGERLIISLWDTESDMKESREASTASRKLAEGQGANILNPKYFTVGIKD